MENPERDIGSQEREDLHPGPAQKMTPDGMSSIQGNGDGGRDWRDRGMVDVPLKDLPETDVVTGPADFDHHIAWADAQSAAQQLPDVQQQVKAGKTADDFSAADEADGLDYPHGTRRVYDLFYGRDPVKLDRDGDQYTIISGRHRIFAARAAGLETIPAWVTERVRH